MESSEMKSIICRELDEHKAFDITVLDVEHLTVMTDYFVICTEKRNKQRAISRLKRSPSLSRRNWRSTT